MFGLKKFQKTVKRILLPESWIYCHMRRRKAANPHKQTVWNWGMFRILCFKNVSNNRLMIKILTEYFVRWSNNQLTDWRLQFCLLASLAFLLKLNLGGKHDVVTNEQTHQQSENWASASDVKTNKQKKGILGNVGINSDKKRHFISKGSLILY